jgi:hypothetical protein
MDKHQKKDLENLLIKQTEKILIEIDGPTSIIFSKFIKSHCKDLAKKFFKIQRKLKKQLEEITPEETISKTIVAKKIASPNSLKSELTVKKVLAPKKAVNTSVINNSNSAAQAAKKTTQKRVRKGNNLANTAALQNKTKALLSKNLVKTAKR